MPFRPEPKMPPPGSSETDKAAYRVAFLAWQLAQAVANRDFSSAQQIRRALEEEQARQRGERPKPQPQQPPEGPADEPSDPTVRQSPQIEEICRYGTSHLEGPGPPWFEGQIDCRPIGTPCNEEVIPPSPPTGPPGTENVCECLRWSLASISSSSHLIAKALEDKVSGPCHSIDPCIDEIIDKLKDRIEGPLYSCDECQ